MTKRQGLRFAAFCMLALGMIAGLGQLLRDRTTTLAGLYSEPKNTVDVFCVGSSHVNSGFVPAVLWQEYGIAAHNVFSWSQPIWISYYYIEEAMRRQKPAVVVLDLYGMLYGNSTEQPREIDKVNYKNSFQIDTNLTYLRMLDTVRTCGLELRNPVDFLNVVRYHTRWKYITRETFTYNPHDDRDFMRGYGVQMATTPVSVPAAQGEAAPRAPYDTAVKWLDKIVAQCQKKGVSLVFTLAPYVYQDSEREIFAWLQNYAEERGIPLLNYAAGEAGARIGFDYAAQMSDAGHLNYKGALAVTRDLGAFLQKKYTLPAAEGHANAAQMTKDAAQVYRVFRVNEEKSADPAAWFAALAQDKNSVVLAAANGDNTALPDSFYQALGTLGFANAAALKAKDTAYVGMSCAGEATEQVGGAEDVLSQTAEFGADALEAHSEGGATNGANITCNGQAYFSAPSGAFFLVYDKVLERPTFYFTFNTVTGLLDIKDKELAPTEDADADDEKAEKPAVRAARNGAHANEHAQSGAG